MHDEITAVLDLGDLRHLLFNILVIIEQHLQ